MNAFRNALNRFEFTQHPNVLTLMVFEILYKLLGTYTVFPLVYLFIIRSIRGLEDTFYQFYISKTMNYIFLGLLLLVTAFYFLYEISVLLKGLYYSKKHQRVGFFRLLKEGFLTTLRYLRPINWIGILLVFTFLPVLHYGTRLALPQWLYLADLSVTTFKLGTESVVLFSGITLLIMLLLTVFFSGAYIIFTECDLNFLASFVVSLEIYKKHFFTTVLRILVTLFKIFIVAVLTLSFLVALCFATFYVFKIFTSPDVFFRFYTDYVAALFSLYGLLFSTLSTLFFFYSVYQIFYGRIETERFHVNTNLSVAVIVFLCVVFMFVQGIRVSQKIPEHTLERIQNGSLLTGHRGNMKLETDNTRASFDSAFDNGAALVELDVARTLDGVNVISHDDNLVRQTGYNLHISDSTYAQIKDLDFRDDFRRTSPNQKILTLEEAIDYVKPRGDLVIELKDIQRDDGFVESVVETIKSKGIEESCYIISSNSDYLEQVEAIDSDFKTLAVFWDVIPELDAITADGICIEEHSASPELVARMHLRNKLVFVWPVENEEEIENVRALEVDNMITNDVGLTNSILLNNRPSENEQVVEVIGQVLRET